MLGRTYRKRSLTTEVLQTTPSAVKIPADVFVRAGYSANASIVIESREGVLTLPESTVEFEGEKTYVYLLTSAEDIAALAEKLMLQGASALAKAKCKL